MIKRKSISKKIRFEVFKRDSFKCQYCGCSAPDVVLEVDHINPVSKGGDNSIMNLLTSCFDCNRGKSGNKLNDNSEIKKQLDQLTELNEKRNQLKMMLEWRDGLKEMESDKLNYIISKIEDYLNNDYSLTDSYKSKIKNLLKKYSFEKILEAIDISYDRYMVGTINQEKVNSFANKILGIVKNISLPEIDQKINYVSGYVAKKYGIEFWKVKSEINYYCDGLKRYGNYSEKDIIQDLEVEINKLLASSYKWSYFRDTLTDWIESLKK